MSVDQNPYLFVRNKQNGLSDFRLRFIFHRAVHDIGIDHPRQVIGHQHRLFINQRREGMTRHGIYRICKKYLQKALSPKRLKNINPAHSFRHSCAVNMLLSGKRLTDIQNRLGHDSIQSTTVYIHMNLTRRQAVQKKFIEYMKSNLSEDPKISEWIDWKNKKDITKGMITKEMKELS